MSATTETAPGANVDLALLVSRILLVAIFPISGYFKLVVNGLAATTGYFANLGIPLPEVAAIAAIAAELILPLLVILGLFTRWAALGLIAYVIGTSIFGHRFWDVPPAQYFGQLMSFMKNICIIGGLLLIAVIGPGRLSINR